MAAKKCNIQWTSALDNELVTQMCPEANPRVRGYHARLEALWLEKHPDLPQNGACLAGGTTGCCLQVEVARALKLHAKEWWGKERGQESTALGEYGCL